MPLSCAGQSYPARMGGRMTADGFSCIIVGSLKNTKLDEFKRIVRRSWLRQRTGELFSRLFGVEKGVRHRTVIVCGIRIKMKNN